MSDLQIEDVGVVRVLTISGPGRANALRRGTIRELDAAIAAVEREVAAGESIAGVVITGEGGRFSAGADVSELSGTIDDLDFDDDLEILTNRISCVAVPIVAAVEGACFGAAIDLAWSCDLVVVADSTRLGLPATRLGILYNPATLARLHARLGGAIVRRLVVVGQEFDGATIGAAGGAHVVDPGAALDTATALVAGMAGVSAATGATKAVLNALDSGVFAGADWGATRHQLLASAERSAALRAGRDVLGKWPT
ncbi:MAG: enoyl-CoA hydratase/isomerase family protein [Actinomycetia bacterium]|nr:enoyl-CoA hydratase/isomerase family protein [Actinomycetes bacterium]